MPPSPAAPPTPVPSPSPASALTTSISEAVLVESKFAPPHLGAALLARSQLSALLQLGLSKQLVAISAPAGYGKTTALMQIAGWAEAHGVGAAWVSLDAEDNDPLRFARYVAAALNHVDGELGRNALAQLGAGTITSLEAVIASLLHDLTRCARPLLLVLDDFHLLHNELLHRKLEWLLAHAPPTLCIAIASRTRLPLSLSQLRVRDALLELDTAHFGLRLEEAADFVRGVSGTPLDRQQIETLHDRTEGWIAGLQLAALAMRGSDDKGAFIAAFSGTDRDITDYLGEQVLESLSPALRSFLLDTAVLERFCVELCDEVLARDDSAALLAEVQARNLFLAGLDRSRTWFRYHHLFADYLRTRSRHEQGTRLRQIALRASAWFDRQRLPHEAVRYAFAANDLERAADLVAQFSGELVQHRGEHSTLLHWLTRLPPALVQSRPKIRTGHAWSLVMTRRYPEAERELIALEQSDEIAADNALRCMVEMIRCVYWAHTGQPALAKARSEAWLAAWPAAGSFLTGVVANVLAFGCCASDSFEQGLRALALARRAFEESDAQYGTAWSSALAVMIAVRRGDYGAALAEVRDGMATVERSLGIASYAGSMSTLLAAEVCYEHNLLDDAQALLDRGLPFVDEHGLVEMTTAGYLTHARLLALRGHAASADACLLEGESLGHRLRLPRIARVLGAERCVLRGRAGTLDEALKLAQSYGFIDSRGSEVLQDADDDAVVLAVLTLRHALDGAGAAAALNDALRRAQRCGHAAQQVRLLLLKAVQQRRALDHAQALRTLDEALELGARCGLIRSFLDGDALVPELIAEAGARRASLAEGARRLVPQAYLDRLLDAAGKSPRDGARSPAAGAGEELTERELKILRLLEAGLGNRELAQSLFLAEATVKWHLHNIFGKLGVKNRTSALARAREISLL